MIKVVIQSLLALLAGLFSGAAVNMGVLLLLTKCIPLPGISDPGNMEQLRLQIPFFEPVHFVPPFMAHALGTFAGALVAAICWKGKPFYAAVIIGVLFLLGGISMALEIPSPLWFIALDLGLAYLPAAGLGFISARQLLRFKKNIKTACYLNS